MDLTDQSIGSKFLLAKAGIPDKNGNVWELKALIELSMGDAHLEVLNDELWYRELAIHSSKPLSHRIFVVQPFNMFPACPKCGQIHLFTKPKVRHLSNYDKLEKACANCGYSWLEETYQSTKDKS